MEFIDNFKNRFPFLLPEDFEAFFAISTPIELKKGQKVIGIGEIKKKVCITLKGIVRGFLINYQGRELTTFILPENHAFAAYEPLILNKPSRQIFETLAPSKLLTFDYNDLEELTKKNNRIKRVKDQIIMETLLMTIKRNESFIMESPEQRYLSFIRDHQDLLQRVSQKHIASFLGITAVSFSRMKKRIYKQ